MITMKLNEFHKANIARMHEAFAPPHPLMALVACVQEEIGELAGAVLGMTGEKKRKAHLTRDDVLDAVADAMTYLSLVAGSVGCEDLEGLLASTFNMVSKRAGSKYRISDDGAFEITGQPGAAGTTSSSDQPAGRGTAGSRCADGDRAQPGVAGTSDEGRQDRPAGGGTAE